MQNFLITSEINQSAQYGRNDLNLRNNGLQMNFNENDQEIGAEMVRQNFKRYFVSPAGSVPWQYNKVL